MKRNSLKFIGIFLIILTLFGLWITFTSSMQDSPYARRIRPFISTPVSCIENEVGYNMTTHTLVLCTNSGYTSILAGSINTILPSQTGNGGKYLTTNGTVASWGTVVSASGDVVGPVSSTDNALVRFDLATGKLIQNSNIILADTGAISFPDGIKQTFNPSLVTAGLNVGLILDEDIFSSNSGDIWYNQDNNTLRTNIGGSPFDICTSGSICSGYQASGSYESILTFSSPLIRTVNDIACPTCGLTSGKLSQFATTTSTELRGNISDENGTGVLLFNSSTSATFISPILGTPTSVTLTNATGLPVSTGISGLGAGIGTFLATSSSANLITAVSDETGSGSLVFGTAPTITLANGTGLPISTGVSGLGTGIATFLATPTGANLAAALTTALPVSDGGTNCTAATITCFNNITGFTAAGTTGTTSTNLVFSTSPTFITPVLGVATGTSISLNGTAGTGFLQLANQSSDPSVLSSSIRIFENASLFPSIRYSSTTTGLVISLSDALLTANRTYQWPDVAGEFTVAGNTFTGTGNLVKAIAPTITGSISLDKTITAGGTTGAQTINKTSGSVNFAAAATSLVVTNSLVSTNSVIQCTVGTNDATFNAPKCIAASGSFTIFSNAAATAETRVNFLVFN